MSSEKIYHADLIEVCEAHCVANGIKETTFGQKVLKDRFFLHRLRNGGTCHPRTEAKVRDFLASSPCDEHNTNGEAA